MKDFSNIENAVPINVGDEVVDIISEYIEKPWYIINVKEEGVYKIEYTKDTIGGICLFEKPKHFFQHSRIIDKTRDLNNKYWIELFYLEKGKTYYLNLLLKPYLKYGSYSLRFVEHEVPANNFRETAKFVDISKTIDGKLDYVTDTDWYKFVAPESGEFRVIYSRQVADGLYFYKEEKSKPECALDDKVYLVNDTVAETYYFEEGKEYYIQVEHLKFRSLAKYIIRFNKLEQKPNPFGGFFR